MERTISKLEGQLSIKKLRLEYLSSKRAQGEKMMEIGAISKDQMEQARLEERIGLIEKDDLEKSVRSTNRSMPSRMESVNAEARSLLGEKEDIHRQLRRLNCGTVTLS